MAKRPRPRSMRVQKVSAMSRAPVAAAMRWASASGAGAERVAAEEEHRRLAGAEDAGGIVDAWRWRPWRERDAERALDHAAFAP